MKPTQIEAWALRITDQVNKGQPNEDLLVELKRDWIDREKAARRIAGHANAAQGEEILWLIGVDEQNGVMGANINDLASWYSSVEAHFNELSPRMTSLNIPVNELTVVALLFEIERAPFVVKNPKYGSPGGGSVGLEVPWRENTSIRTARRSDLIRLLAPLEYLPDIEIIDGRLSEQIGGEDPQTGNYLPDQLELNLDIYIVPKNEKRLVIPFHRCQVNFELPDSSTIEANWLELYPSYGDNTFGRQGKAASRTIESTANEIIVNGPGRMVVKAIAPRPVIDRDKGSATVRVLVTLPPTGMNRSVVSILRTELGGQEAVVTKGLIVGMAFNQSLV